MICNSCRHDVHRKCANVEGRGPKGDGPSRMRDTWCDCQHKPRGQGKPGSEFTEAMARVTAGLQAAIRTTAVTFPNGRTR